MLGLSIIGAGRVGKTLASLWIKKNLVCFNGLINKRFNSSKKSVLYLGSGFAYKTIQDLPISDIYMISCNDDAIEPSAIQLADSIKSKNIRPVCFHLSGSLSSKALQPLKDIGAFVASIHPLKSFADPALSQKNFAGTFCSIEGDKEALNILIPLFETIGSKILHIHEKDKIIYHTALSMASNHLVGLIHVVQQMLAQTQIPQDKCEAILKQMVSHTLNNIWALGTHDALTGPIVRGDSKTVQKHINKLCDLPKNWTNIYQALGAELLNISNSRGEAQQENLESIKKSLSECRLSLEDAF
jgi:predicted short-subunit dehydrogenase-like oxidoreductase (DUF2520 family)